MARLADAATLTAHLGTLTDELHREVTERGGDLATMIELADRISESADELANALTCINDALNAALSSLGPASVTAAEPAASAVASVAATNGHGGWSFGRWARNDVRRLTSGARRLFGPASRPQPGDAEAAPTWERPRRNAALVAR